MKTRLISAVAGLVLSAAAANAASISVTTFSVMNYNDQLALLTTPVIENFEGFAEQAAPNGFSTSVGTFSTLGGVGSGDTVTDTVAEGNFPGNDGKTLAVRDGDVYGRTSTTALLTGNAKLDKFLDSNDTWGISWTVDVGKMFNKLIFTLTDGADQGATLTIATDGAASRSFSLASPSNRKLVVVDFGGYIENALITLSNTGTNGRPKTNDGFSIDDVAVSAVPLPAPALMLLAGLGGLAALRRKRAAA